MEGERAGERVGEIVGERVGEREWERGGVSVLANPVVQLTEGATLNGFF